MKARLSILVLSSLMLSGCNSGRRLEPYTEVVMTPGMTITATNPNGSVTIRCGQGTTRTYTGEGWQRTLRLIARTTRWNGSLGLYDPAGSTTPYGRLLAEEGRIYLSTEDQFLRWLSTEARDRPVYTSDGLVFAYGVEQMGQGHEPVRWVEVWQVYLDGKKPSHLKGATDRAFVVEGGTPPDRSQPYPAPVGYALTFGKKPYGEEGQSGKGGSFSRPPHNT